MSVCGLSANVTTLQQKNSHTRSNNMFVCGLSATVTRLQQKNSVSFTYFKHEHHPFFFLSSKSNHQWSNASVLQTGISKSGTYSTHSQAFKTMSDGPAEAFIHEHLRGTTDKRQIQTNKPVCVQHICRAIGKLA